MSAAFEKLGAFYLGRRIAPGASAPGEEPVLYDSRDLTTHALIVGMTGSGKTGLGVALLEEAAIDGIPALVVDPKGDLGNLLLTFPDLAPASFSPWVDPAEATRQGLEVDAWAARTAEQWRDGLAAWGQDGARIQRLRDAAEFVLYTPGSSVGRPLRLLGSFEPPAASILADPELLRETIGGTVSGLLGLIGVDADPLQSREHILLATLLEAAWRGGRGLDLPGLIRGVQEPPFERIGVLDLESIFPAKDRFGLALRLNQLLASPAFSVWMEGEALEVGRLLQGSGGRPRVAVLSLAHLDDAERMFFVTLLLNQVVAWMRTQSGTSSLRAILYMDEIFGYFPPGANPPSKPPMLTLLKQARAFGLGVVLSTQNPVDLDYKGLGNCGTWFLGRLQTERDKLRLLDGLEGASTARSGSFDRATLDALLSGLGKRVFLMNNIHDEEPTLFQTRWTLSYLRGPLSREQVQRVVRMQGELGPAGRSASLGTVVSTAAGIGVATEPPSPAAAVSRTSSRRAVSSARPVLPAGVGERFLAATRDDGGLLYRPMLTARVRLHYVRAGAKIDLWTERLVWTSLDTDMVRDPWASCERLAPDLDYEPEPSADAFAALPVEAERPRSYPAWAAALRQVLYRTEILVLKTCPALDATSGPGETEDDFRARLSHAAHESRDLALEKLRTRYETKFATLRGKLARAEERIARESEQVKQQKVQTAISLGTTVIGAFFGRKRLSATNVGRAGTTLRSASRIAREQGDLGRAEESLETLQADLTALEAEFAAGLEEIRGQFECATLELAALEIPPRKADLAVEELFVLWTPWVRGTEGEEVAAFRAERLQRS